MNGRLMSEASPSGPWPRCNAAWPLARTPKSGGASLLSSGPKQLSIRSALALAEVCCAAHHKLPLFHMNRVRMDQRKPARPVATEAHGYAALRQVMIQSLAVKSVPRQHL